jgi:hypothetical protein
MTLTFESRIQEIRQLKHANDSSRMLYIWKELWDSLDDSMSENLEHYLTNIIKSY